MENVLQLRIPPVLGHSGVLREPLLLQYLVAVGICGKKAAKHIKRQSALSLAINPIQI